MAILGNVSTFNINGNELTIKDAALTEIVNQIIEAIGANNTNIAERINDLHDRSFDSVIKIESVNESEIASIQDGMYKIQYITTQGTGDDAVEILNNSAILIQKGTNQYLYKDGQISSRIKTNNAWGNWTTFEGGVTSVNGMTGAVTIVHPVTSVNGMTGAVTIQGNIKPDWDATAGSDAEILNKPDLSNFLTIETQPNWNETNTSSAAYIQNKPTIVNSVNGMTGVVSINIPDVPVTSVNGMTGAVTINIPQEVMVVNVTGSGTSYTADKTFTQINTAINNGQCVKVLYDDVNYELDAISTNSIFFKAFYPSITNDTFDNELWYTAFEFRRGGSISYIELSKSLVTSVNGMTGAVTLAIPTVPTTSTTVTQNDTNPVSGGAVYAKFEDLIGSAPAALDTLEEIATALNNDENLAGTLTTQISSKVPKVSNPTTDNFASFNSDGTIKDSGHSHSDYVTSVNGLTGAVSLTLPTVNDSTVTVSMNGVTGGSFTLNQNTDTNIDLKLKTVNNESLVGTGNVVISGLPLVTAADNGKILMVVNGQWQLVSPSVLYSGNGVPNNANGNNGDLFMQTN